MERGRVRWRIYYEDGSTFDSTQGAPHESPPWGAVVVIQNTPKELELPLQSGGLAFLYWKDLGFWRQVDDQMGLNIRLAQSAHLIECVRFGTWAIQGQWNEISARAAHDLQTL